MADSFCPPSSVD